MRNIVGLHVQHMAGHRFKPGDEVVVCVNSQMNHDRPSAYLQRGVIAGVDDDDWCYRVTFESELYNNWFKDEHLIDAAEYDRINSYIESPDTVVEIFSTAELGFPVRAVRVAGTDIWLDAFYTASEARRFIDNNHLRLIG